MVFEGGGTDQRGAGAGAQARSRGDLSGVEECVRQMDALAGELRCAMDAIATNAGPRLAESVGRQRLLVAALEDGARRSMQERSEAAEDASWRERYRKAARALRQLNEEYAVLIEHAGRSARMLAQLRQTESGALRPSGRSWSINA